MFAAGVPFYGTASGPWCYRGGGYLLLARWAAVVSRGMESWDCYGTAFSHELGSLCTWYLSYSGRWTGVIPSLLLQAGSFCSREVVSEVYVHRVVRFIHFTFGSLPSGELREGAHSTWVIGPMADATVVRD